MRIMLLYLLFFCSYIQAQKILSFEECLELAFANNLDIKNAEISEQIALDQYGSSIIRLLPNINVNVSNNHSWGRAIDPSTNVFVNQEFRSYSGGLNSAVELFSGFKNINLIKFAKQELELNKTIIQKLKNDITIDIASKYTTILYLKEIISSNENQIKSTKEQLELIQLKSELGYVPESDVFKIRSQLANEQLTLINNQNLLELNELELKQLMNISFNKEIMLQPLADSSFLKFDIDKNDENIILKAIEHNPSFLGLEIKGKKNKIELALARASLYPSINMSFGINSVFSNNNMLFTFKEQISNNLSYGLAVSLSIPVFNQLQNRSKIKESKLNFQKSLIDVEIEKNRLLKLLIQTINDANASYSKYESALYSFEFSEKSYQADLLKLKLGKISINDFINTKNNYTNSQAELIRSKYELMFNQSLVKFYIEDRFQF